MDQRTARDRAQYHSVRQTNQGTNEAGEIKKSHHRVSVNLQPDKKNQLIASESTVMQGWILYLTQEAKHRCESKQRITRSF